jgi:hypothetical protein
VSIWSGDDTIEVAFTDDTLFTTVSTHTEDYRMWESYSPDSVKEMNDIGRGN